MAQLTALGTVHGNTIELETPVPSLNGCRVRLVVEPAPDDSRRPTTRDQRGRFGCAAGVVQVHEDFDAPLSDFADYER
ncbi:hypothetical protein ACFL5O_05350 [Myxococcota bacterium]